MTDTEKKSSSRQQHGMRVADESSKVVEVDSLLVLETCEVCGASHWSHDRRECAWCPMVQAAENNINSQVKS